MTRGIQAGNNRTGIKAHPERARTMIQGMEAFAPTSPGSAEDIAALRVDEARLAPATGIDTVPMPEGPRPTPQRIAFLDKLGARLAFERSAVRMYEALLVKHRAFGGFDGGPKRVDLETVRAQELTHVSLLSSAIKALGGDPTALTPSASLCGPVLESAMNALTDPRTTLRQGLDMLIMVELADNESWESLIDLAIDNDQDEMSEQFAAALAVENEHLDKIRAWLTP